MFFLGRNFVTGILCVLKHENPKTSKTLKTLKT